MSEVCSFLLLSKIHTILQYGCTSHLSTHQLMGIFLLFPFFLAIINNAARNIQVKVFVWMRFHFFWVKT